ncbi:uncharacterized protein TNCV_872061 [Trichonephila clavipes]|nr:uncharacterized protein TNCV_872061 [Trichonephila clavipes]
MEVPLKHSLQVQVSYFVARRNHLDHFTRLKIIGKLEERRSLTSASEEFGINKSVVSCAWKAFQTISTAVRRVGGDRPRKTTAVDDRDILLQAKMPCYL